MTSTASSLNAPPASSAPPPQRLLDQQNAGSLLRNILAVFKRHWLVLQLCGVLPVLPWLVLQGWLGAEEFSFLGAVILLGWFLSNFAGSAALTVAISDICLGQKPSVRHSFGRALSQGRWWRLLAASSLLTAACMLGLVLLVLPGLWLLVHGLLLSTVVVLESRRPLDALQRAIALVRGQAWRIAGLVLLVMLVALGAVLVVSGTAGLLLGVAGLLMGWNEGTIGQVSGSLGEVLGVALCAPVFGITLVLLYYDQRVRREAYDAQALAEDLMR